MEPMRQSLLVTNTSRDQTRAKGAWGTNEYAEELRSGIRASKRPGTASAFPGITGVVGQGLFNWNNGVYAVVDDQLYTGLDIIPAWDPTASYISGEPVSYQGVPYVATTPTTGVPPPTGWSVCGSPAPWNSTTLYPAGTFVTWLGYTFISVQPSGNINRNPLPSPFNYPNYFWWDLVKPLPAGLSVTTATVGAGSGWPQGGYSVYAAIRRITTDDYANTVGPLKFVGGITIPVSPTVNIAIQFQATNQAGSFFSPNPLHFEYRVYVTPWSSQVSYNDLYASFSGGFNFGSYTFPVNNLPTFPDPRLQAVPCSLPVASPIPL